jgi:hypothetical protein
LPSGFAVRLTDARDINATGQITGWGTTGSGDQTKHAAFLLTPTTGGGGTGDGDGDGGGGQGYDDVDLSPLNNVPDNQPDGTTDPNANVAPTDGGAALGLLHFLCGVGLVDAVPFLLVGLCCLKLGVHRRQP